MQCLEEEGYLFLTVGNQVTKKYQNPDWENLTYSEIKEIWKWHKNECYEDEGALASFDIMMLVEHLMKRIENEF